MRRVANWLMLGSLGGYFLAVLALPETQQKGARQYLHTLARML